MRRSWVLSAVFFASGAAALTFENLWFHQVGVALGNSVWASSVVLSSFMAGLALGNLLAGRYGDRAASTLRGYAACEVVVALSGLAVVWGLPLLAPQVASLLGPWGDQPLLVNLLRVPPAFLALVAPSTAMGATLPLLTAALSRSERQFGGVLGALYGWNTLGAMAGALAAEIWAIPALGIRGSGLLSACLCLGAAGVAFVLARGEGAAVPKPAPANPRPAPTGSAAPLAAAFLSGFAFLGLEVVWFRFLQLFVIGYSLSFAVMLATVLGGIALGGLAASAGLRRWPEGYRQAGPLAFLAGAACLGGYALFYLLLPPASVPAASAPWAVARLALPLMLPVALASGVLFTLVGASLRGASRSDASAAGALALANTVGAAAGAAAGGLLLLPALGVEASFFVLGALYGAVGLLMVARVRPGRWTLLPSAALLVAALALFPFGAMTSRYVPSVVARAAKGSAVQVLGVREGLTETAIYLERYWLGLPHHKQLLTNAFSMSGTEGKFRRYMKLFVWWPVAVHPEPRRALLISFGVGCTAEALTQTRSLERIDVVDISRDILETNDLIFPDPARQPLRDPRVVVHVEDGRFFLQSTKERYDLITGEPPPPEIAGIANLYSREYFQLVHDRLAEGGVATYWLPIHALTGEGAKSIVRAFCDVFEDATLWHGMGLDLILVGTRGARGPVSEEAFRRQWRDPAVAPELARLGLEVPAQLGALYIDGGDHLRRSVADRPPLVDDFPRRILGPPMREVPALYRAWLDPQGAAGRFESSEVVRRLWPEAVRRETLGYFGAQSLLIWVSVPPRAGEGIPYGTIHEVMVGTTLRAPILWAFGSSPDLQEALAAAPPEVRRSAEARYHGAVELLSRRRYAEAASAFAEAEGAEAYRQRAWTLRVYALALAGEAEEARLLLAQGRSAPAPFGPGADFNAFFERTFPDPR